MVLERQLTTYRGDRKQREKFATREALDLAREYSENPNLKRGDVRATKLVDELCNSAVETRIRQEPV